MVDEERELDLQFRWKRFSPAAWNLTNPDIRGGHTMTLVGDTMMLFGGHYKAGTISKYYNDTWFLDPEGTQWGKYTGSGMVPEARGFHTATGIDEKLVIIGGRGNGGKLFNRVQYFDCNEHRWDQLNTAGKPPQARYAHSSVLIGNKIYMFGGTDGTQWFNDLHVLDLEHQQWYQPAVHGPLPTKRGYHTAVSSHNAMFVMGGTSFDGKMCKYYGDGYVFDPASGGWQLLKTRGYQLAPRSYHSAATIDDAAILIYGGFSGGKALRQDLPYLDLAAMSWCQPSNVFGKPPTASYGCSLTSVNNNFLLFGGWDGGKAQSDCYALRMREAPVRPGSR